MRSSGTHIITPNSPAYDLENLWSFRDLFYFLVWRDIKVRYKQTIIGVTWVVLQPFLTMVVFSFVFGTIVKISSGDIPYPVFVYTGLILWNLFARSITVSADSVTSNQSLVKNMYFPKIILPLATIMANLVDFAASFFVLILLMTYFGISPSLSGLLILPPAILVILLFASGVGVILSSLNVVYRDVRFIIPYALQIFLFLTPVVYPTSMVEKRYRTILTLNPLAGVIEAVRDSLLTTSSIDLRPFLTAAGLGIVIFFFGIVYFQKREGIISDIV